MKEAKRKWIVSNVLNGIFKMIAATAWAFIIALAIGAVKGVFPVWLALAAIAGAYAVGKEFMDAVIELEGIIREQERYMRRRKMEAARIRRKVQKLSKQPLLGWNGIQAQRLNEVEDS